MYKKFLFNVLIKIKCNLFFLRLLILHYAVGGREGLRVSVKLEANDDRRTL